MKILPSLSARLLGAFLWQAWSALVGFFNDRLLPERFHVRPETLPEGLAQLWARYLCYRQASRPGAIQFRGLTVDPGHPLRALHRGVQPVRYRGCWVETAAGEPFPELGTERVFVPPYWRPLNTLRLKLNLADLDRYPVKLALQRVYRGREF
ncbi:hypothetical protein [Synechococcus sp. OH2]|uniref:hypothetical protein n=1 Tax=Synechococcus sp. OH2 TaxID=136798 RepID=UPI0039C329C2